METEKHLYAKILAKTMEILEHDPELSELLNEMPVTIPNENNPQINVKILKDYYNSLENIFNEYHRNNNQK